MRTCDIKMGLSWLLHPDQPGCRDDTQISCRDSNGTTLVPVSSQLQLKSPVSDLFFQMVRSESCRLVIQGNRYSRGIDRTVRGTIPLVEFEVNEAFMLPHRTIGNHNSADVPSPAGP